MVSVLIAISLILLIGIGIAALLMAGKSHSSSSVEDLNKDDD